MKPSITRAIVFFLILNIAIIPVLAGVTFTPGSGVTYTGAGGVTYTGAGGVTYTGAGGVTYTGAGGVTYTGAGGVTYTGAGGVTYTGAGEDPFYEPPATGIAGFDTDLALLLDKLPNTSILNVVITYHRMPTSTDFNQLRALGILGGTYLNTLPMVLVNATKSQIQAISRFSNVRSIFSNKTIGYLTHESLPLIGMDRVNNDVQLRALTNGQTVTGKGVTIAVVDTGVDALHPDLPLGSKVVNNAKVADLGGTGLLYTKPIVLEGQVNTDELGHGTFVSAVAAGSGAASSGYYGGVAKGANILGVSVGNVSMFFVLSGFDYVLKNKDRYNVRVVNCSFVAQTVYDANDPINIATRILHDRGITVVVASGNNGPRPDTLNPYSIPPWVIGVASGNKEGQLSNFSSRGGPFYHLFHPTLTAPGEGIVSARSTLNLLSDLLPSEDDTSIPLNLLPRYTKASGTSFAAPHVAGVVALMLEANPALTPDQIKHLLQMTASPMLNYSRYEVGAGYLNAYAAVSAARVAATPYGAFRSGFASAPINFTVDAPSEYQTIVPKQGSVSVPIVIPDGALKATIQLGWRDTRPVSNDLSMTLRAPDGTPVATSNYLNLLSLLIQREGIAVENPPAGTWTVELSNTLKDLLLATDQPATLGVEIARVAVNVNDIGSLPASAQNDVRTAVRTLLMDAPGGSFRPAANVSRGEFARALMLASGAQVPQYAPFTQTFTDVSSANANFLFVESVTHSLRGNLIYQTDSGTFRPESKLDRLTAAVAYIKALGLDSAAASATNPGLSDWDSLPTDARGHVALAVTKGIIAPVNGAFNANGDVSRADLAQQLIKFQQN